MCTNATRSSDPSAQGETWLPLGAHQLMEGGLHPRGAQPEPLLPVVRLTISPGPSPSSGGAPSLRRHHPHPGERVLHD